MTRLIDADALLKKVDLREGWQHTSALKNLITNAPTFILEPVRYELVKSQHPLPATLDSLLLQAREVEPTVQQGWVSVPAKLPYDDMRKVIVNYFDRATKGESFLFDDFWLDLIKSAPKLNEVKP